LGIEGCRWVHSGAIQNKRGHEECNLGEVMELSGGYWEHKERWRGIACFWSQVRRNEISTLWRFFSSSATNALQAEVRGIEHAKAQNRAQSGISDGEIPAANTGPPRKKEDFARSRRSYLRLVRTNSNGVTVRRRQIS
jgi:hypothetical protein